MGHDARPTNLWRLNDYIHIFFVYVVDIWSGHVSWAVHGPVLPGKT